MGCLAVGVSFGAFCCSGLVFSDFVGLNAELGARWYFSFLCFPEFLSFRGSLGFGLCGFGTLIADSASFVSFAFYVFVGLFG